MSKRNLQDQEEELSVIELMNELKDEILEIEIDQRNPEDESDSLEFNWEIYELSSKYMSIQLNFTNPIEVSASQEMDQLLILFIKGEIFRNENGLSLQN